VNGWRWVDQAVGRPHRCAIFPQIGNGMGHSFIDTGQRLDLEDIYISDVAAEQIAEFRGWVRPEHLHAERQRVQALEAQVEELGAKLAEAEERWSHVDGLARHGLGLKKVSGRKPKQKETSDAVG
jgi:hypothetical protein